jgi:FAD-dependent urate hydroxylase
MSASIIIVGAGPFGLAVAAGLRAGEVRYRLLGEPMSFWRRHMPHGMVLRSAADWHLDPLGELTIERFLGKRGTAAAAAEPLPIATYLAYAAWFQERAGIVCEPLRVQRLEVAEDGRFRLVTEPPGPDGAEIVSDTVVLAVGQRTFAYVPPELAAILPPGRFEHTCDLVRFDQLRAKRVVIIGGRQSAFEWAALISEAGAASVDIVHRHPSPAFAVADWDWATRLAEQYADDPGWYQRLSSEEQAKIARHLWGEGRLKVEPWLASRLADERVRIRPNTTIIAATVDDDRMHLSTDHDDTLIADRVILATGYRTDVRSIRFLAPPLMDRLAVEDGYPKLGTDFQTAVPGLFVTGALAGAEFGPLFGFTVTARPAAVALCRVLRARAGADQLQLP